MTRHFISIKDFDVAQIKKILLKAQHFSQLSPLKSLDQKFVSMMFLEPSTRTKSSFEMACMRLGANVLNFDEKSSSMTKGESFYDTVKTLEAMGVNAVVVRCKEENLLRKYADEVDISFVNAGEGSAEHPTQALLDALTIQQNFKRIDNLTITILGDIKHSRVARSNLDLHAKLGNKIILSVPRGNLKENDMEDFLQYPNVRFAPIDEAIEQSDVVMALRIQFERHHGDSESYTATDFLNEYGMTEERYNRLGKNSILLHPGPFNRDVEIASTIAYAPKSRILQQVKNGVFVRMSVIDFVLQE